MRYGLLAASLALLGSGGLAAQSAIAIQHEAGRGHPAAKQRVTEGDYRVTILAWDETAEGRRYLLAQN